jgi:hypothetical protein
MNQARRVLPPVLERIINNDAYGYKKLRQTLKDYRWKQKQF